MKTLVVFYSRTGNTRKVATEIATACGADVEAIEDAASREGVVAYLRSIYEAVKGRTSAIKPTSIDPLKYDTVIVGGPVWAGHMASPLRTYLAKHWDRIGHVAVFCTMGGSGAERTLREMASEAGLAPMASLALAEREIDTPGATAKIEKFVARVRRFQPHERALAAELPPLPRTTEHIPLGTHAA